MLRANDEASSARGVRDACLSSSSLYNTRDVAIGGGGPANSRRDFDFEVEPGELASSEYGAI